MASSKTEDVSVPNHNDSVTEVRNVAILEEHPITPVRKKRIPITPTTQEVETASLSKKRQRSPSPSLETPSNKQTRREKGRGPNLSPPASANTQSRNWDDMTEDEKEEHLQFMERTGDKGNVTGMDEHTWAYFWWEPELFPDLQVPPPVVTAREIVEYIRDNQAQEARLKQNKEDAARRKMERDEMNRAHIERKEQRKQAEYAAQKQRNKVRLEKAGSTWTSLVEIYAKAEAAGEAPVLPEHGPPCQNCERLSVLEWIPQDDPNPHSAGRPKYVCSVCDPPFSWVTFGDLIGTGAEFLCKCGEKSRETLTGRTARVLGPGRPFWTCAEGLCNFKRWPQ